MGIKKLIVAAMFLTAVVFGSERSNSEAAQAEPNQPKEKQSQSAKGTGKTMVEMQTSMGKIVIELDSEKAPKTVENFLSYVKEDYYNGTIFHRVIPGFMVQGGGFEKSMSQKKTKAPIVNEASNGLKNDRGTLAMARTSNPNSATSQFFINLVDNDFLNYQKDRNPGYAVFGKVVEGMDVVDKIAKVKTGTSQGMGDVPVETVMLESAKVVE